MHANHVSCGIDFRVGDLVVASGEGFPLLHTPPCDADGMISVFPLQAKAQLKMGLESITDTNGPLGGLKWFAFFGASFVPSLFLAGYFLGGYYPGLAVGAPEEPAWWPTSMQVSYPVRLDGRRACSEA